MSGGTIPRGATVVDPSRLDGNGWFTAIPSESSALERARDAEVERLLDNDGRPLSLIAVVAQQRGARWEVEILHRVDLLDRLDARGRDAEHESDRLLSKKLAAWIRGLPHGVCPELFSWEVEGGRAVQRATIARTPAKSRRQ